MKRLAVLLTLLLAVSLARAADCPKLSIRGPCPKEVKCLNIQPCPTVSVPKCPDCTLRCPDVKIPSAARPAPCPSCPPCAPSSLSSMPSGHWSIPLTVGWLPGQRTRASWLESYEYRSHDPSIDIRASRQILGGAGLAYEFPSRWQIAGQVLRTWGSDQAADWRDRPRARSSDPSVSRRGGQYGFAVTVMVPLP